LLPDTKRMDEIAGLSAKTDFHALFTAYASVVLYCGSVGSREVKLPSLIAFAPAVSIAK